MNSSPTSSKIASFSTSVSRSVLKTFQYSFQEKMQSLQSFQSQLKEQRELTIEKFETQKQQLQTLVVEVASFLDDLMLPLIEENPFFLEDFFIFIEESLSQLETQIRLFGTLSLSSLRKQIDKTSQKFETKALKDSFEKKQKQTLAQTEELLQQLNEQLIDIRHRIEKLKDKVKGSITNTSSSLPKLSISPSEMPSLPTFSTISDQTISSFELIKQDIKRLFM